MPDLCIAMPEDTPSTAAASLGVVPPVAHNPAFDLARYMEKGLPDALLAHSDLAPRDRCRIEIACLIARYRGAELGMHLRKTLDTGVDESEIMKIMTHLTLYTGWPSASSALEVAHTLFQGSEGIPA